MRYAMTSLILVLGGWVGANAQEVATSEQLDKVLEELRQIRLLLESKEVERAPENRQIVDLRVVDAHRLGSEDAPVTIVEFTDFACPFCRQFVDQTFTDLKSHYVDTGIVRFYVLDFPLVTHENASKAAEAGRCARDQNAFWQMFGKIHGDSATLTVDRLVEVARSSGVDVKSFRECVESGKYQPLIEQSVKSAMAIGVQGTPTFIIGASKEHGVDGEMLIGAMPLGVFEKKIDEILSSRRKSDVNDKKVSK
jgi:protein-disulfide isomerase